MSDLGIFTIVAIVIVVMLVLINRWHKRKAWRDADRRVREIMPRETEPYRSVSMPRPLREPPRREKVVTAPKVKDRRRVPADDDPSPSYPGAMLATGALLAMTVSSEAKADETPTAAKFESGGGDFGGSGSTTSYSPSDGGSISSGGDGGSPGGGSE